MGWARWGGGPVQVGHDAASATGFAFDNESRHTVWLAPFDLARRPVSNGEFLDFIDDGGYRQPALWLSDGWAQVQAQGWQAPAGRLPRAADGSARQGCTQFTLHGEGPLEAAAPVCHLSGCEAAAYAAWAGACGLAAGRLAPLREAERVFITFVPTSPAGRHRGGAELPTVTAP